MQYLIYYLILINAISFLLMLTDKRRAIKKSRRIPERTLLGICAIGGSLGGLLGMHLLRHKTLHSRFSVGIPVMLAVHIFLIGWILLK